MASCAVMTTAELDANVRYSRSGQIPAQCDHYRFAFSPCLGCPVVSNYELCFTDYQSNIFILRLFLVLQVSHRLAQTTTTVYNVLLLMLLINPSIFNQPIMPEHIFSYSCISIYSDYDAGGPAHN